MNTSSRVRGHIESSCSEQYKYGIEVSGLAIGVMDRRHSGELNSCDGTAGAFAGVYEDRFHKVWQASSSVSVTD